MSELKARFENMGLDPQEPFIEFLIALHDETDRGSVLASAAYIDDLLGQTIAALLVVGANSAELIGDDKQRGPLSDFHARILTSHALGLISARERDDCTQIRKVRNKFAHAVKMSFEDEGVKRSCAKLKLWTGGAVAHTVNPSPRKRYEGSAIQMIALLSSRMARVREYRLKEIPLI